MPRDADETRRRFLDAARAEFAERGFAGARVDRIAEAAGSNKAQIYYHFGSKDGLFDAVFDEIVGRTLAETPLDPTDLPEYAARLFDGYLAQPDIQRIATWHRLERGGSHRVPAITGSYRSKLDAIATAQRDGVLGARWSPEILLAQILAVSAMWATLSPEFDDMVGHLTAKQRRRAVYDTIAALLA